VQGGRQAAGSFTRKHMLSGQTLEMLADMRMQFASMLADIGFVRPPGRSAQRGVRGSAAWVDDRKAAWNQHSAKPAVVSRLLVACRCHK
jgi:ATP-dependent RNA helicase DHX29